MTRRERTIEGVPSEVEGVVTEVTNEFSSGNVLHDGKFQETNKGNNLRNTSSGDGVEGGETVGDIREGEAGVVNVSGQSDSCCNYGISTESTFVSLIKIYIHGLTGLGDQVSSDGKHGDTSVLDLHVSETVEFGFITIGDKSKRIEESKRSLGTDFIFEGGQRGGLGGFLGRSERCGLSRTSRRSG